MYGMEELKRVIGNMNKDLNASEEAREGEEKGAGMEKGNEPIAGLVKDGVVIHMDYAPVPECTMFDFTYVGVCIKCNVCGRFKDQPKPTEAEVRARLGRPLQGEEAEGWGYDSSNGVHHWYDRLSSVAECGWAGRPDDLYSDEFMRECVGVDFCVDCVKARNKR